MISVVLRLRQRGYVRAAGYQAIQWMVTVPVSDPITDPLIGTSPLSFASLFLIRKSENIEFLERVCITSDFPNYQINNLIYFEPKGLNGDLLLNDMLPDDELIFPDTLTGRLSYWLEDDAPYNTNSFKILQRTIRKQGTQPQILTGSKLILPGYHFTNNDIDRWVYLNGMATPSYNNFARIISFTGDTATINKPTTTNEAGSSWLFPVIEINPLVDSLTEPKFFPTKEQNLSWQLKRAGNLLLTNTNGGATLRQNEDLDIFRVARFTSLMSNKNTALGLFGATRREVELLQKAAQDLNTNFTNLITSTYGP